MLRLLRVRFRDFRGIENATLDLGDITVLMGENNVGKTALLDALDVALGDRFPITTDLRIRPDGTAVDRFIMDLELTPWTGIVLPPEVTDALGVLYRPEPGTGRQRYFLRVIAEPDTTHRNMKVHRGFATDWDAPDTAQLDELSAAQRRDLWFSLLDAQRDLVEDLRQRTSPWGKLLRRLKLDNATRKQFEQQLSALSASVMQALPDASLLAAAISRLNSVLAGQVAAAKLSLLPKTLEELWKTTDLLVQAAGQPELSIGQQGMGARSLSSLLAFRAWLEAELAVSAAESEAPLLVVTAFEEPETHLHPQAQRAVFAEIADIPAQRIISTHSPYVASVARLDDFRVVRRSGSVTIRSANGITASPQVDPNALESIRRFCIQQNADMIFARLVLLCEGDTDLAVLSALARVWWGGAAERIGVSIVGMDGAGNAFTFARFLSSLGVPWLLTVDGDTAGNSARQAIANDPGLAARAGTDVFVLSANGVEVPIETFVARLAPGAVARTFATNAKHAAAISKESETDLVTRLETAKGSSSRRLGEELAVEWSSQATFPPTFEALFKRADQILP